MLPIAAQPQAEEMQQPVASPPAPPGTPAITLQSASFQWTPTAPPLLHDLSLSIPSGALVLVVGDVGCGKTSLLQALMGEMLRSAGSARLLGSTAYTAQDPWIQNASVRANILMGGAWEPARYHRVLEACALLPDLALLPAGDQSEIGEKGINLSGGQRHRVALARWVGIDEVVFDVVFDGVRCGV